MRTKINEALENVLKKFGEKYFIASVVNKSKVIQDLDTYDEELLTAFISNDVLKDNFTIDIAGNTVLQTNKLIHLLEADEYWQDSYTKYSKKIGLTAGGKFIDENEDVVLEFPYKDTILKASMSKEDTDKDDLRPDEPFLNEVIAKEEIDTLLDKKIFVNVKKYDENGKREIDSFDENDNLIIKGNNLLALHALKDKYVGKVKLIYMDPPYNTGNDSFKYNDSFNLTAWLTFMKNRLEVAKDLLSMDGAIFIQISDKFMPYLTVLMDDILHRENRLNILTVKMSEVSGVKMAHVDKRFPRVKENILVYRKSNDLSLNEVKVPIERWNEEYKHLLLGMEKHEIEQIKLMTKNKGQTKKHVEKVNQLLKKARIVPLSDYFKENPVSNQEKWKFENAWRIIQAVGSKSVLQMAKREPKREQEVAALLSNTGLIYLYKTDTNFEARQPRVQVIFADENIMANPGDLWLDIRTTGGVGQEGGVLFPNGKKPELLISRIIQSVTKEKDIVLDFFMGSATTQAVAHKMNRRYIGVEQMDYIHAVSVPRLQNVIEGEQSGISKDVNWQGGGSFVYAELMEKNKGFIDAIRKCETQNDIDKLFTFMLEEAEIDFRVDLEKVKDTLHELSLDDQKKTLFKIIEKNQLYYNYSEIDDENVRDLISDSEYKFNKSFYEGGE